MAPEMMPIEFSFESTPALAKLAARRFIQRRHGLGLVVLGAIGITCFVALLMGFRQWYVITGIVLACIGAIRWINYYFHCDAAFKSMPDPTVTVRMTDDSIEFETSELKSQCKWGRIKELWIFRGVWLLFTYDKDSFTLIPADALTDEATTLAKEKVAENGGKVT